MVELNKRGKYILKYSIIAAVLISVLFVSFGFAAHVVRTSTGTTSYNINEDVGFIYNITINNTDDGAAANITQVNITFPSASGFLFVPGTQNGTNALGDFTNTSNVLTWTNTTWLINGTNGTELKYFWFNATVANPGNYNITIMTLNGTGAYSYYSNITVVVNDTTVPSNISYGTAMDSNGANYSRNYTVVNVSAIDNGVIDKIVIRLYNSTAGLINTSTSSAGVASYWINFTGLSDGVYYFNATVNDTAGNSNSSISTYSVRLDTAAPAVTVLYPSNGVNYTRTQMNFTLLLSDSLNVFACWFTLTNGAANYTMTLNSTLTGANYTNSSITDGASYTAKFYCNDTLNNINGTSQVVFGIDNTAPLVAFVNPVSNGNYSGNLVINVSSNDTISGTSAVFFNVTNSSGVQVNISTASQQGSGIYWNATLATSAFSDGLYNITVYANNTANGLNSTERVQVRFDNGAPVITLITPTNGNMTTPSSITFSFNVTDDSTISNCSLTLDGAPINSISSNINRTGGTISFVNLSYVVSHTWNITCRDIVNNAANSSTWSFSLASFQFNGTSRDEDGNLLNNSVVNVTIRSLQGWTALAYISGTSNATGWFNFSIPSNASWMYEPSIRHTNVTTTPNFVDFKSKTIPTFPQMMIEMLAGTTFYLAPAGTINITAINSTSGRIPFQYQVKDTKLGYPVAEEHTNWNTEVNVYVPKNRNYSIMIYPNQSMPVSFNWNNFSSSLSYNLTGSGTNSTTNASKYLAESSTLHKQFNTGLTMVTVNGYITNSSGTVMNNNTITWNNFTVIPFLLEPGNMVHSEYGDMPYNLSSAIGLSDFFNLTSGFYNISLPGTAETSNVILFATAVQSVTNFSYGGFRNISPTYGGTPTSLNFTMYGLLGTASNITMDRIDGANPPNIAIQTAKQNFNLVNATNSTLSSTMAHIETTVDYSSSTIGAIEFTWMSDVQQSASQAIFSLPLLNVTGIKEMNVYASGGPSGGNGQYAPKRVSTRTAAQIISNSSITLKLFNPEAIDASVGAGSISIALYVSNSTCDVPNPPTSCQLGGNLGGNMADFNPMKAVMGGGKISFRMGTGNILVHYVNVDLLASGPPDALFDSATNTNGTSGSSFAAALRFGSQGPTIYDYVLVSMPYTETAGSGLNESAPINISIPLLYDDNWNVIWNTTANGSSGAALAGNYSHYSTYQSDWGNLTISGGKSCNHANVTSAIQINTTEPCRIDNSSNRIWIRLPHFSGTGPNVAGSVVATSSSTTPAGSSGGSGGETGFWKSTFAYDTKDFSEKEPLTREYYKGYRVKIKLENEVHYVGVVLVTNTSATINVSSTPQQATLNVGESKKFEVTDDNFYDILVRLNKISGSKANITISSIHEAIPAETEGEEEVQEEEQTTEEGEEEQETISTEEERGILSIIWAVIIGVIALAVIIVIFFKLRNSRKKGRGY